MLRRVDATSFRVEVTAGVPEEGGALEVDIVIGSSSSPADDRFWETSACPAPVEREGRATVTRTSEVLPLRDTTLTVLANAHLRVRLTAPDEVKGGLARCDVAMATIPFSDVISAAGSSQVVAAPYLATVELFGATRNTKERSYGSASIVTVMGDVLAEHCNHGRVVTFERFELEGVYVPTAEDEAKAAAAAAATTPEAVVAATPEQATPAAASDAPLSDVAAASPDAPAAAGTASAAPATHEYRVAFSVPCDGGEQPIAFGGAVVTRDATRLVAKWDQGTVQVFLAAHSSLTAFEHTLDALRVDVSALSALDAPPMAEDDAADGTAPTDAEDWTRIECGAQLNLGGLRFRGATFATPAAPLASGGGLLRADWTLSCAVLLDRSLERAIPGLSDAAAAAAADAAAKDSAAPSRAVGHARCAEHATRVWQRARARARAEERVAASVAALGEQLGPGPVGISDTESASFKAAALDATVKRLELALVQGGSEASNTWSTHRVYGWLMQTVETLRRDAGQPQRSSVGTKSEGGGGASASVEAEWSLQRALEAEWRGDATTAMRWHHERVAALAGDRVLAADAWSSLGSLLLRRGSVEEGRAALDHAAVLAAATTTRFAGRAKYTVAATLLLEGDVVQARAALEAVPAHGTLRAGLDSLVDHFTKLDRTMHPTVDDLLEQLADASDQLVPEGGARLASPAAASTAQFDAKLAAVELLLSALPKALAAESEEYKAAAAAIAWLQGEPAAASGAQAIAVAQQLSRLQCRDVGSSAAAAAAAARTFAATIEDAAGGDCFDPKTHWQLAQSYVAAIAAAGGDGAAGSGELRELALASLRTAHQLAIADAPDETLRLADVGGAAYSATLEMHVKLPHELGSLLLAAGAAQPARRVFAAATSALAEWGMGGSELLTCGLSETSVVSGEACVPRLDSCLCYEMPPVYSRLLFLFGLSLTAALALALALVPSLSTRRYTAEDELHTAVALNPRSVYPWAALAKLACSKGNTSEARQLATRFVELATGTTSKFAALALDLSAAFAEGGDAEFAADLARRANAAVV